MPASRSVVLPVPAEQAFALVTDVRRHADWVPRTRIEVDGPCDPAGHLVPGGEFTAVTGPTSDGPGLVDRMRLTELTAPRTADRTPGTAHYVKLGPVLTGWAQVEVRPLDDDLCEVTWTELIGVRGVPAALTSRLGVAPTAAMLRTVLGRIAREVTASVAPDRAGR